ncbi:Threonine/homoserine/homoserine lactone efflux protein [Streptomyces zhaozhouensis]|uniref:Threonine/homoserine/homoserine lactone efflux protein n=1 Tax=Streptomyces zhaozhouensis TaxID=1300267 RepID=A0A286DSV7_9ACTN|nr:LysE family translocator [Streptomyces zhaozhouensis]SOD61739.1 Threonine/homoserine/homoserine lactone efflux protein [Streptomyces zhaozhouensis]
MTPPAAAGGFALAVLPLVATPGASLALLTRHVAEAGRRRALPVILGTASGLYAHAAMAMAGLSALLVGSETAFTIVRLLGAAYLIALAGWTWRRAVPRTCASGVPKAGAAPSPSRRFGTSPWLQSLLGTVLNPKAAAVYLTLAPQFLDPARPLAGQLLLLATVHAALVGGWLALWTALLTRPGTVLTRPRARAAIGRVSALALLALGIGAVASL